MPATIDDVARLAGVSTATVSRALRGLPNVASATRERVARAASLLDYVADPAASALAAGHTDTVGVVLPTIGRWSHARILEVVTDRAAAASLDVLPVMLASAQVRQSFLTSHPFRRRVDGLVLVEVPLDASEVARLAEGRPVVAVGLDLEDVDVVVADEWQAVAAATQHLVGLGHRAITYVSGGDDEVPLGGPTARREAFELVLRDSGVPVTEASMVETQSTPTGGAAAMMMLLDEPHVPTAVITASDEMALGAMEVARSRGLSIPGDLSVVGIDDQPIAQYVGLTTVHRDVTAMATTAAEWVLERIVQMRTGDDTAPPPRRRVVPTDLVVRRTSGRRPTAPGDA